MWANVRESIQSAPPEKASSRRRNVEAEHFGSIRVELNGGAPAKLWSYEGRGSGASRYAIVGVGAEASGYSTAVFLGRPRGRKVDSNPRSAACARSTIPIRTAGRGGGSLGARTIPFPFRGDRPFSANSAAAPSATPRGPRAGGISSSGRDVRKQLRDFWLTHDEMGMSGGGTLKTLEKRGRSREFRRDHRVVGTSHLPPLSGLSAQNWCTEGSILS
jgi:hypothetical protein